MVRRGRAADLPARMKTMAPIDIRSEGPGETVGILVSRHPDVMAAFVANDAFQKADSGGRHIRTKIVTLKDPLDPGQPVRPTHLAESK
jgi:hypothetical protein